MNGEEYYKDGYEDQNDSVITRTLDGRISSWNLPAEQLYGWRKDEVIGQVSHRLLQTQFPKPLEEIESDLVRIGQWEGRLVHTTRDGNRVVVESRWIIDARRDDHALIEINKRSMDGVPDEETRRNCKRTAGAGERPIDTTKRSVAKYFNIAVASAAAILIVVFVAYGAFGHALINILYGSDDGLLGFVADLVVPGRATTRLEEYYYAGDTSFLLGILYVVVGCFLLWWLINEPVGMLVSAVTLFVFSLFLFTVFELFPSLITRTGLQHIRYYGFSDAYVPDDVLGYRERPFRKETVLISKPGINAHGDTVPVRLMEWSTDAEGFRNSDTQEHSDVVLLGDSFVEYGDNISDTLGQRLEKHLQGLTVRNLGKSGYGPFQYLEVFRRYGIKRHPRYALFCFYEGNDLSDIQNYLKWKSENRPHEFTYAIGSQSFLQRYIIAVKSTVRYVADHTWPTLDSAVQNVLGGKHIYPDLVVVRTGDGETYQTVIEDKLIPQTTEEASHSQNWIQLKHILNEFKTVALENNIKPVIVYLPSVPQIYADYTTEESGKHWRAIRQQQISSMGQAPRTMAVLADQLKIPLIDLTPAYRAAAQEGGMLYENFNVHWNAEGRELAARLVAQKLTVGGHAGL